MIDTQTVDWVDVTTLSRETLRRTLLKGSMQMIKLLIMSDPQRMGAACLDALALSIRPQTLQTLIEEVSKGAVISPEQIATARGQFLNILRSQNS